MSRPILEISAVSKRFGAFTANEDILLALAPGEIIALLAKTGPARPPW